MSTPTPSIPGVNRNDLGVAIHRDTDVGFWLAGAVADVALAHIAAHHECACDREHADEWVEVDKGTWGGQPEGTRRRLEWVRGDQESARRDDLPDDPRALIAREIGPAKADTFLELLDEHGWTVTRKGER